MRYSIGIDIGKSGGIAVLDMVDGDVTLYPIPILGKDIDIAKVRTILEPYKADCMVGIELVHAIFGSAAKSTFEFGFVAGVIETVVVCLGMKYVKVQPKIWQKECWEGVNIVKKVNGKTDTKAMSLVAVTRLYPDVCLLETPRCKNPHDGLVDALLIAHYIKLKRI